MNPPYKITNAIINFVSSISELLGAIEAKGLSTPDPELRRLNKIRTIQASLAIEGNTLTLDQMTAVLEGKKVLGKEKEILEVQNAVKLYDNLDSYKPFKVKELLRAHKILMTSLIRSAGKFRDKNVGVLKGSKVAHVAPKSRLVPELITNLFAWGHSEKDLHALIKSCIFHYELEFIHPFEDGNGRMGRFWQSVMLVSYDPVFRFIPLETVIKKNQKKYYRVLEACDKLGDSTQFIEFTLESILLSLQEFSSNTKGVIINNEVRLIQAKRHFAKTYFTRKTYMILFKNISSATASRDLKEGVNSMVLLVKGSGNQTKYKFVGKFKI